ncbi:hypothetical protein ABPG72_022862 [Tetrahymena utriculariae]
MNLSMPINPHGMQAMVKRDALTPRGRFSNRKITKKEINFINTLINKSQFNNGKKTQQQPDRKNLQMKIINDKSYFAHGMKFQNRVLKRDLIYKEYFSKLFIQDTLCILIQLLGILTGYGFPKFLANLFRLAPVKDKFSRMDWHRKLKQKLSSFYDLIKLISFLLIVIHIFGCGFCFVGNIYVKSGLEETNWIIKNNIQNSNVFDQYIRPIYFITITMVTIDYGDITPVNSIEIINSLLISFISCGLFGYCINFIGSIFTELFKKSKEFQKKLLVIIKYLNSRNIDQSNQIRVLKYLEYIDESQEENILEGYIILNSCSKDIKEDIMKQFYGSVIKKCRLFKEIFSKELIESLSLKMQERCFAPGQTILKEARNQIVSISLQENQKNSLCIFENQVIDLRIFMAQQKSDISIRSKGITVVSFFDHQTFLNTICQYQDYYLIESYKKTDDSQVELTREKIQTEGLINVKNIQFADDILQQTDSMSSSSSSSSSSSESSDNSSSEQSLDETDLKLGSKSQTITRKEMFAYHYILTVTEENNSIKNLDDDENKTIKKIQADDDILNLNSKYFQKEKYYSFASQVSQDLARGYETFKNNNSSNYSNNKNLFSYFNEENPILEQSSTSDFKPRKQREGHKHTSLISNQQSLTQSKYKNTQLSSTNIAIDGEEINKSVDKHNQQKQGIVFKQY